jgi:hypothetical protein
MAAQSGDRFMGMFGAGKAHNLDAADSLTLSQP